MERNDKDKKARQKSLKLLLVKAYLKQIFKSITLCRLWSCTNSRQKSFLSCSIHLLVQSTVYYYMSTLHNSNMC